MHHVLTSVSIRSQMMPLFRKQLPVSITVFCFCLHGARRPSKTQHNRRGKKRKKERKQNPQHQLLCIPPCNTHNKLTLGLNTWSSAREACSCLQVCLPRSPSAWSSAWSRSKFATKSFISWLLRPVSFPCLCDTKCCRWTRSSLTWWTCSQRGLAAEY